MFDSENERKYTDTEAVSSKKRSHVSTVNLFKGIAAAIAVSAVIVVFAILLAISKTSGNGENQVGETLFGNPNRLTDPDIVTSDNLREEYESRPEMPEETPAMLENSMMKYLSNGDFSGLDSFLAEQMSLYKDVEGDEGQDRDDWQSRFEMLRADVAKTNNLTKDMRPDVTLSMYTSPEILAGTVAWAPASVKLEAFEDWSSLILPSPGQGQHIDLKRADLKAPHETLREINKISPTRFYDLTAFDMTISGYNLRLIIVADQFGYYRPWTLRDIDGVINREIWTKRNLKQIRNALDPWTDFDSVLSLGQRTGSGTDQERSEHPEWYDDDGVYIGPDRYLSAAPDVSGPVESTIPGEETTEVISRPEQDSDPALYETDTDAEQTPVRGDGVASEQASE